MTSRTVWFPYFVQMPYYISPFYVLNGSHIVFTCRNVPHSTNGFTYVACFQTTYGFTYVACFFTGHHSDGVRDGLWVVRSQAPHICRHNDRECVGGRLVCDAPYRLPHQQLALSSTSHKSVRVADHPSVLVSSWLLKYISNKSFMSSRVEWTKQLKRSTIRSLAPYTCTTSIMHLHHSHHAPASLTPRTCITRTMHLHRVHLLHCE